MYAGAVPDRSLIRRGSFSPGSWAPTRLPWLEYQAPNRFSPDRGTPPHPKPAPRAVHRARASALRFDPQDMGVAPQPRTWIGAAWKSSTWLHRRPVWQRTAGFDKLICLPLVRDMGPCRTSDPHRAPRSCNGFPRRANVAMRSGLAKTIEAGSHRRELRMRGLIRSALFLTPTLVESTWQGEMRSHFAST